MKTTLIRGLHNLARLNASSNWRRDCVLTIGNFDGVHVGHRVILKQVVDKARELGVVSRAMIFEPQPLEFFSGEKAPARLTTFQEKLRQLSRCEIDSIMCVRFDEKLRTMEAEAFVKTLLVEELGVRHVIVGDDFRFGARQRGDFQLLTEMGRELGFTVESTKTVLVDDERVSSTRIRAALDVGDFEIAEKLLARPYGMIGRVISGQKLARQLGFPTANLSLRGKVAPLAGVYAVDIAGVLPDGAFLQGVANVGIRPTVGGDVPLLEVHILDYEGDLYYRKIIVLFRHRIRDERKFADLEALSAQIKLDAVAAREFFSD